MRNKRTIKIIIALGLIFTLIFICIVVLKPNRFNITFKNNTLEGVNNIYITYRNIDKDIKIPEIKAGSIYKIKITPKENFGENIMKLYYFDKLGNKHEDIICGYFEKGYGGRAIINIESVNKNGDMKVNINFDYDL